VVETLSACRSLLGHERQRTHRSANRARGGALAANDWRTRERHLAQAYEVVARLHNALGVTEQVAEGAASFHGRPFLLIHADRFVRAAERAITDATVRNLSPRIGPVNQWVDSTDVLERPSILQRLRSAYGAT
jgi:hypothetical protein